MNEEEIKLICNIITYPAGFDLDIGGLLCIRRYEHQKWAVEWESYYNPHDVIKKDISIKEFDDPMELRSFSFTKDMKCK